MLLLSELVLHHSGTTDGLSYTAAFSIESVQCADSAAYTVVFTNEFWKAASPPGLPITVYDESFSEVPQVTVSTTGVPIVDPYLETKLTATACFNAVCWQSYQTDSSGGDYLRRPIPGANGPEYHFPQPVTCDSLGQYGYFVVEAFDADWVPHVSEPIRVYGACQ